MNKMIKCVLVLALAPVFSIAQAQSNYVNEGANMNGGVNRTVSSTVTKTTVSNVSNTTNLNNNVNTGAYLTDSSGAIVKSNFGLCWRTSSWTPQTAIRECDPDLFKDIAVVQEVQVVQEVTPVTVVQAKAPVSVVLKTFFNFDKDQLTQVNKDKLRDVANKMREFDIDTVTLKGHADRIGSDEYNENLSQRRADVVKAELVSLGVAESKIMTEAKGETQPEVTCDGRTSPKVIACLAPNRRVEIEVVGSEK